MKKQEHIKHIMTYIYIYIHIFNNKQQPTQLERIIIHRLGPGGGGPAARASARPSAPRPRYAISMITMC